MGELIRYFIVGLIAVGIDLVTTKLVKEILFAQYPQAIATHEWLLVFLAGMAGCAVGMTAIYLMSLRFVFRHRAVAERHVEFVMFMVIGVVGIVLQLCIYWSLNRLWIRWLEHQLPHWGVGPELLAFLDKRYYLFNKLFAIGLVFLFSFVTRRQLLFRRRHVATNHVTAEGCV